MRETIAFHILELYQDFLSYTRRELKKHGMSFGQMPMILYIGKHTGCSQSDLTNNLRMDWGYSQRSVTKLVDNGFIRKEYDEVRSCHSLLLTEKGRVVFESCHKVFYAWDQKMVGCLTTEEKNLLTSLLGRLLANSKES